MFSKLSKLSRDDHRFETKTDQRAEEAQPDAPPDHRPLVEVLIDAECTAPAPSFHYSWLQSPRCLEVRSCQTVPEKLPS